MSTSDLLTDITQWLSNKSMADSTFGKLAINDGKLVSRLKKGGQCLPSTESRIREFMAQNAQTVLSPQQGAQ